MTLQDDVSALKDGDYVVAVFDAPKSKVTIEGEVQVRASGGLTIGGERTVSFASGVHLQYRDGSSAGYLTSVTVIAPPPPPPEPEVGSFALLKNGSICKAFWDGTGQKVWERLTNSDMSSSYSWPEIYPQIKKLWDKDGNEVAL